MRAIEFNSRIEENKILIPRRMQSEFFAKDDNKVRVVVFLQDQEVYDYGCKTNFSTVAINSFAGSIKGLTSSSSILTKSS